MTFPTAHAGGELALEFGDAQSIYRSSECEQVSFCGFLTDVQHRVARVTDGIMRSGSRTTSTADSRRRCCPRRRLALALPPHRSSRQSHARCSCPTRSFPRILMTSPKITPRRTVYGGTRWRCAFPRGRGRSGCCRTQVEGATPAAMATAVPRGRAAHARAHGRAVRFQTAG